MQAFPFVASLLLTSALLAGCLAPAEPDAISPDAGAGTSPAVAVGGGLRAIPITGFYRDYVTGVGASCHEVSDCDVVIPVGIDFTGTIAGKATGVTQAYTHGFDAAKRSWRWWKSPIAFTGTIDGCGSGSLNFFIDGDFRADASAANESGRLVHGSQTTGFADLVDVYWAFAEGPKDSLPIPIVGTAWCREPSAPGPAGELLDVPITGVYRDYVTGGGTGCLEPSAGCDPAVVSFGINFTGTMRGEAFGMARMGPASFHPEAPDHPSAEKDPVTFTGTIDGCGAGSLALVIHAVTQLDAQGGTINETGTFVPGSATGGLAGVEELFFAFDEHARWPAAVPIHGFARCRAPASEPPAAGAVRAIPIEGLYRDYTTTGGGVSCGGVGECEGYVPWMFNFTGTLTGDSQGVAYGDAHGLDLATASFTGRKTMMFTGSIEGCGSGSLAFVVSYRFQRPDDKGRPLNETGRFVPGSATTGFANVVDVYWEIADGAGSPGPVPMSGTVLCR